ncbi:MAG: tripartite tricarboxylate transporter substrate binding protein [Xanthobacteraceae bacterium]
MHIIVGLPAGLTVDTITRLIAQSLSEQLGRQFIVENRPGAATNIATEAVVRSPSDGYTLLAVTSTNTINATLYDKLNFDFVRDIAPVAGIFRSPNVLEVNPSVPVKTFPEFLAYAKAHPGQLNYASPGSGSATNVAGELLKTMAGIDLVHVPYRSSYLPDLISGQVQLAFSPIAQAIGYIKAGKLRALAVTGATRSDALPDIPTVGEFVPGYEAYVWSGIGAPKDTPVEIIDKLNKGIDVALADPSMKVRFANLGADPIPMTPVAFGKFITEEVEKWGKVIRAANIKAG